MFSLPLQEPEGDRDEADQKDRCGYKDDHVRRYGVHGRDDRRETFRICFGLGLTSDYRLIAKKAGQAALHPAPIVTGSGFPSFRCMAAIEQAACRQEAQMWGGMAGLVLQLIAGAVGGGVIGTTIKRYDLGIIGNLLVGIVGGGIGAQIIGALVGSGEASAIVGPDGFDFGTLVAQFAAGACAGGALVVATRLAKENMGGPRAA
jgi:hypothetical protein